jgi:hypothetical protein
MRIVDLSVTLENDADWAPWYARNRVKNQSHAFGAWVIWWLFGIGKKHLRTGLGWANDTIRLSTHESGWRCSGRRTEPGYPEYRA